MKYQVGVSGLVKSLLLCDDRAMVDLMTVFHKHPGWLEVQQILSILHKSGFKAYLAGGCVRDALLNQIPKDFDIATSARPEQILKLFPNSNQQGKAFGVVAVFCKHSMVEVATFRKDGPYLDGRHPEYVEFLDDKEDALRRDFTINALFYDIQKKQVIDYVKGVQDLKNKIIRTVGQPEDRFTEDKLRMVRALRFQVQLDFNLDSITENAVDKMKNSISEISRERVYEECLKMLKTGRFEKALSSFQKLEIPKPFWSVFSNNQVNWQLQFIRNSVPAHLMKYKGFLWLNIFYPLLCLHKEKVLTDRGKWCAGFSADLKKEKFPRAIITEMETMFYHSLCLLDFLQTSDVSDVQKMPLVSLAKKLKVLDFSLADPVLYLSKKYLKVKKLKTDVLNKIEQEFKTRAVEGKLAGPLVNGEDLKAVGVAEDKKMALLLDNLYDYQLEHQITDKKDLLKVFKLL